MNTALWYDSKDSSKSFSENEPTSRYFIGGGEITYRSDWGPDALFIYFSLANNSQPTGHFHPDRNQVLISYKGAELLTDAGYSYFKTTQEHNTLLVNGFGQKGENTMWSVNYKGLGEIEDYFSEKNYMHLTGIASMSYRPEAELNRYNRHLTIYDKYVFIIDDVRTNTPKEYEIRFHNSIEKSNSNNFKILEPNKKASLVVNGKRIIFYTDATKATAIKPSYYYPPDWSSSNTYDFLTNFVKQNPDLIANETSEFIFDKLNSNNHSPSQKGYYLSETNKENKQEDYFINLLIIGEENEVEPKITTISQGNLVGFDIMDKRQRVIYLFNKEDLGDNQKYSEFNFDGKMITAIQDITSEDWTIFGKGVTLISKDGKTIFSSETPQNIYIPLSE